MSFALSIAVVAAVFAFFPVSADVVPGYASTSAAFLKNHDLGRALEMLIPVSERIQNEKCRNHSRLYLHELKRMTLWATEMFDATAKFPSGVLIGSTYAFGNFDECVQVKVPLEEDPFAGKYCLSTIKMEPPKCSLREDVCQRNYDFFNTPFNVSMWDKIISDSRDRSKGQRNVVQWGFCIPSSCTGEDLQIHLREVADIYNQLQDFKLSVEVDESKCQVEQSFFLSTGDIVYIVIVFLIVCMVLAGSAYELALKVDEFKHWKLSRSKHELAISFSIVNTLKKIFAHKKDEDKLDCIHGLKVYSMLLVIMGHRIMFVIGSPTINSTFAESYYSKIETMVLLNGPIIVDSFFSISGFLASYLILQKREEKARNTNFIILYVHRILRLTPVYAVILAFYCTLFVKTGAGPLWHERVGVEQERCIASWWANLLYINNYVNTEKICMFQSWYITCDMHLFLITPFIIWLLRKNAKVGCTVLGTLIFLSMLSTFLTTFFGKLDAILLLYISILRDPTVDQTFKSIYIPTHTRASPYLVGIATGYLLYRIKKEKYEIPKKMVYIGWIVSVLIMEAIVYSAYIFYMPSMPYDPHSAAAYSAVHHFLWSISISWFILAIATGNGTLIDPLLSWKPLSSLSRITYTAFLCHGGMQLYSAAALKTPMTCDVFHLVWYTAGDVFMAFVGGLILTVFFEAPVVGIEKILFGTGGKRKPEEAYQKKIPENGAANGHINGKVMNGNITPVSFIRINDA